MKRFLFSVGNLSIPGDIAALLARLSFGGMILIGHGWPKLQNLTGNFEKFSQNFNGILGMPGAVNATLITGAEFLAAAFLIVGFLGRLSAIPLIIGMSVATFIAHANAPFFAQSGGASKEFPALYLAGFLICLILGPGKFSVDKKLS